MRTKIVGGFKDELSKLRLQMPASGDPRAVVNLAGAGRTVIIGRTLRGIGAGNKPFQKYSTKTYRAPIERRPPGYPKPSGGRSVSLRTGKPLKSVVYEGGYGQYKRSIGLGNKVTLSVSNNMLGAIQIATTSSVSAELFFAGREAAAKAHGHEFGTTVPKRSFFDLADFASEEALNAELLKYLREAARRAKLELRGRAR